jgi:hypothetical protein
MRYFLCVGGLLAAGIVALPAMAASQRDIVRAEDRYSSFTAVLPGCSDASVLGRIQGRFSSREGTYWNSQLSIIGFEKVAAVADRPWGADFVPRRFCTGVALMSDGAKRRVDYMLKEDLGIIGATWGLNWCVNGLDYNRNYAPECRMAQP